MDVPQVRENGARLATGLGALGCLAVVAAVPVARGGDTLQRVGIRVAAVSLVLLVAALVLRWSPLVPLAIAAAGGLYAAQLSVDGAALDSIAPVIAAGLLLVAELAYWSLEEADSVPGDPGAGLRHAAFLAVLALAAVIVGVLLLALVDVVQAEGLALDVVGAIAASAILAAIVLGARGRGRKSQ